MGTLSLKINATLYLKICNRCDSSMKRCCHGMSAKMSRKQEMELAVTTVANASADSAPPIPVVGKQVSTVSSSCTPAAQHSQQSDTLSFGTNTLSIGTTPNSSETPPESISV